MLRFGCCGNLCATLPDRTGIENLPVFEEQGYDYFELPVGTLLTLPEEERQYLHRRITQSALKCEVCNIFFPPSVRLTGDSVDSARVEAYYRRALRYAAGIGTKIMVFGSPQAKSYPPGFSKSAAFDQLVTLGRRIDEVAFDEGITIAIEPIRSPECNIINTYQEGAALARAVNGRATKVLVDYYHMLWEKEPLQDILDDGELLAHVHFAAPYIPGEGERVFPLQSSEWDYAPFVETLRKIGYRGRISIEAYSSNVPTYGTQSLHVLRELFDF